MHLAFCASGSDIQPQSKNVTDPRYLNRYLLIMNANHVSVFDVDKVTVSLVFECMMKDIKFDSIWSVTLKSVQHLPFVAFRSNHFKSEMIHWALV